MKSSQLSQELAEEVTVEVQDDHQSISVSDLQWIEGVTKSLNRCREKTRGRWPCTIFKVPEDIRQCDTTAYDPFVVTIGPYHYLKSNDRTVMAMQDHKWHCMRRLLSRHTKSRRKATDLLGKCLMAMREKDADVRGSYSEGLHHLSAHDLALIMLLDGCFIIHVLLNSNEGGNFLRDRIMFVENNDDDNQEEDKFAVGYKDMVALDVMGKKQMDLRVVGPRRAWVMMLYDLVKVENQIPFIVIQTLFNELKTPEDEHINLVEIALDLLRQIHPSSHSKSSTYDLPLPESNQVHHLLHLFHSTIVPSPDCREINPTEQEMDTEWIPSATELQLAGVEFVRKKENVGCFLDISFKNGTIEIAQLTLYQATITLFRNLMAYEQCYPHTNDYVTAYVCFMDNMINAPKDVELFELKGIFINTLGTPDNAATLINRLSEQIQVPANSYLQGSIEGIRIYYESKWHKWRARLMRDYFDNPWTIVSLAAALILLLLTVEQSFFAAYSYFHPPKG
ncbi:hypothetical protein DsansV1_C03g0029541 [Dioscorea sansibarensis]